MIDRTREQIQAFLDANLHRFDLPAQYLGDEPNARRKDWDQTGTRMCLISPWGYQAAAANQSVPAVYATINDSAAGHLCDRFYQPATPRDLRLLERARIPVFGIETKHQIRDFDLIGTSISYPLLAITAIKMLTMSHIPPRWSQRAGGKWPMVMAGGQCYGSPEILAPVLDCWWLGEVEDEPGNPGLSAVCDTIAGYKQSGVWQADRIDCYADLARTFDFLYFPRFVKTHYAYEDLTARDVGPAPSKQVCGLSTTTPGIRLNHNRRIVKDLDQVPAAVRSPLLYCDPAMGSGDLEVARGCPAWCTFCGLTYRQKPYRQRSVDKLVDSARALALNMGCTRVAPFSPDIPTYTLRKNLIRRILTEVSDEVDAPSMRVDDFVTDPNYVLLQVLGGMDSVTLGVEGSSQRMRDLVGKGTSDADICQAISMGIQAGIRKFKLFMISNLPGEDEADLIQALRLARKLADIRESMAQPTVRIQFSWTPFMLEANTPCQWFAPQIGSRILGDVWEEFRALKIDFKVGSKAELNKVTFYQLCQRASRDVGEALVDTMLEFDQACWGGVPRTFTERLEHHLRSRGFHNGLADCFNERIHSDMFGWEHINCGVPSELLWAIYVRMREHAELTESQTYDCQLDPAHRGNEWLERCDTRCQGTKCKACDPVDLALRSTYLKRRIDEQDVDPTTVRTLDQTSQVQRIRIRVNKPARWRFVENAHWRFAVRRAAFRALADLAADYQVAKRSIRFSSDEIRHRTWVFGVDYVELALTRWLDQTELDRFVAALGKHLAPWLEVDRFVSGRPTTNIRSDTAWTLYTVQLDEQLSVAREHLRRWKSAETIPMRLPVVSGYFAPASEEVDARDFVTDLWLRPQGRELNLRMQLTGRVGPHNVMAAFTRAATVLEVTHLPVRRLDAFKRGNFLQQDFELPNCGNCGLVIPTNLINDSYHPMFCPRCLDQTAVGVEGLLDV